MPLFIDSDSTITVHIPWSSTSSHKSRDGITKLDVEGAAPEIFVIGESDTEAIDVEKTSDFQNSPPLFTEYSLYIILLL